MATAFNLLFWTIKASRDLISNYFSEHMSCCFCLIYSTPATLALMIFECAKKIPASGTWHFLLPLSGMFFLQIANGLLFHFFQSLLSCGPPGKLPRPLYLKQPCGFSTYPLTLLYFFSMARITSDTNDTNSFIVRPPSLEVNLLLLSSPVKCLISSI